jgi:hypothetical protein
VRLLTSPWQNVTAAYPLVDKVLTKPGETIDDIVAEIETFQNTRVHQNRPVMTLLAADLDFAYHQLARKLT